MHRAVRCACIVAGLARGDASLPVGRHGRSAWRVRVRCARQSPPFRPPRINPNVRLDCPGDLVTRSRAAGEHLRSLDKGLYVRTDRTKCLTPSDADRMVLFFFGRCHRVRRQRRSAGPGAAYSPWPRGGGKADEHRVLRGRAAHVPAVPGRTFGGQTADRAQAQRHGADSRLARQGQHRAPRISHSRAIDGHWHVCIVGVSPRGHMYTRNDGKRRKHNKFKRATARQHVCRSTNMMFP